MLSDGLRWPLEKVIWHAEGFWPTGWEPLYCFLFSVLCVYLGLCLTARGQPWVLFLSLCLPCFETVPYWLGLSIDPQVSAWLCLPSSRVPTMCHEKLVVSLPFLFLRQIIACLISKCWQKQPSALLIFFKLHLFAYLCWAMAVHADVRGYMYEWVGSIFPSYGPSRFFF